MRSYVFIPWFSDVSVTIKIDLACFYAFMQTKTKFSKYCKVYMILSVDSTE
jgi:hypothetical protein